MPHGPTTSLRPLHLPPPFPSTPAEAIQLKAEAETFNLTECSRHLNYLTVVLFKGVGMEAKVTGV